MKDKEKTKETLTAELKELHKEADHLRSKLSHSENARLQLEETLLERQERLNAMFEFSTIGMAITSPTKGWIEVNDKLCNMLGYSSEELTKMTWSEITHPEDLKPDLILFNEVLNNKRDGYKMEKRFIRKDGRILFTLLWVTCKRNKDRSVNYIIALLEDITERKLSEAFLKSSLSLLNAALDSTADGLLVISENRRVTIYNNKFVELWKIPNDLLSAKEDSRLLDYVSSQLNDPKSFIQKVEDLYEMPEAESFDVIEFKDGRIYERYSIPQKIDGKAVGRVWNFRDVTARAIAEKELKQSVENFKTLFEKAPDAIFLADIETGYIIDANEAASKLLMKPLSEIKGMHQTQLHPKNEEQYAKELFKKHAAEALQNNQTHPIEHYIVRSDGSTIPVEVMAQTISIKNKPILQGVFRDITERKKMEDAIKQINKNLEKRVKEEVEKYRLHEQILIQQSKMASMGEMIGLIAHQLKQPLNAILLTVQDLNDAYNFGELNKEYIAASTEIVRQQIVFMSKTIDSFRDFLRPSKEKIVFDVKQTIKELIDMFDSIYRKNNIEILIFNKTEAANFNILGYPNEFKQVVLNIINNATDEILNKQRKTDSNYSGNITITINENEENITVSILDNGGGIAQNIIDKIFEPYFSTKPPEKGTGIGLYMSKTIVENNMNGKLNVINIAEGAEFTIELKRVKPSGNLQTLI
ncbi:multi-sensor signal transduction histidine kinase [Candidatus Magnetoovum chiemensis]|nr:multi-sensor signal transduction histidine kinase [Candidatus Magnetoovum chiemensis]